MLAKVWVFLFALLAGIPCFAQFPGETDRLMATARLWVTVDYFHPYLAIRHIDWDHALVAALPKIRSATSNAEYTAALSEMLAELHDSETRVMLEPEGPSELSPAKPGVSLMRSANGSAFVSGFHRIDKTVVDLNGATAVVRLSSPEIAEKAPLLDLPGRDDDAYPTTEVRLLAAIKLWGAVHYFFAYRDLMDEDWDELFPTYLAKFIEAKDALDYNLVLADLLTHLTDTNATLHSKTMDSYFGEVPAGLRIRLLDKYPIVTDVLDPAAKEAGVQPGDVLKRIGSVSTTDVFRRLVQYVAASTPQRSGYDTIQRVTNGAAGSEVQLTIENSKGEPHVVQLTRSHSPAAPQRNTEAIRILPGNIGYLDLERLSVSAVDPALARLKDTRAIIFDLRAPAAPAANSIASHLTSQANVPAAFVTTPIALYPDITGHGIATQTANTFVVKTLPAPRQPHYQGKTIALIDERTIGEAEYAGMLFEAANKTEFVGAPSAGADGSFAELSLPGGIVVTYSSEDVRHANGGKLQRLGLQPNITAPTTAKGLLAGSDEPLAVALTHLSH